MLRSEEGLDAFRFFLNLEPLGPGDHVMCHVDRKREKKGDRTSDFCFFRLTE